MDLAVRDDDLMHRPVILGRDAESALLANLLEDVGSRGAAVVLTGMAGIGKSTLLAETRRIAAERKMLVLTTSGVTSEADLPFASLHRLLRPILPQASKLPAPQREAIAAAFGISGGSAPEPFMIALGILELLGEAAAHTPLLLSVEDAHWLDRPTADALAFVGRRIGSDPIVLLAALREGYDSPLHQAGLSQLHLERLSDEASARLLEQADPALLPGARRRALAEAEGNPLALWELAATLGSGEQTIVGRSPHLPLTQRLEEAFAARAAELPAPARTLVHVVATAEDARLAKILAAATIIDGSPRTIGDLVPAIQARLLDIDGQQVRFRHPLVRSAIYQAATVAERHATHVALADQFIDDPDRRAWHRLAAATGPDPAIAAEVEAAGRRAARRGAVATAAVAFERAAGMETDAGRRGKLLLDAAAAAAELGRLETVSRLLLQANSLELGPLERAQWMWLEDTYRPGQAGDPVRVRDLVETALQVAALGARDLALNLLVAAASRCHWGNLHAEGRSVVLAADAIGAAPDDQRMLYVQAFAAPLARGAAVLLDLERNDTPTDASALYLRGMAVCLAGAFDRSVPLLAASAERLRNEGRLRLLAGVLSIQAWAALLVGDLAAAVPLAEESRQLGAETKLPMWEIGARVAEASIAAVRGDEAAVETLTAETTRFALPIGAADLLGVTQYARGMLELGYGRHAAAYEQLRRIRKPGDPAHHQLVACHTIGDFTEAAVRSGNRQEAEILVRETEPMARQAQSPWIDLQMAYARVHLADPDDNGAFDEVLGRDLSGWPFFRARVELAYGEWLRRRRRRLESRVPLRSARDSFDIIGATPWAARAREELRAAGVDSRPRHNSLHELTPQELQIAQMVAQGLTNGAIAQRLYVSRRTVESHLYRIFHKLGVSSRAQLIKTLNGRVGVL